MQEHEADHRRERESHRAENIVQGTGNEQQFSCHPREKIDFPPKLHFTRRSPASAEAVASHSEEPNMEGISEETAHWRTRMGTHAERLILRRSKRAGRIRALLV
jgi:hypothetical protein